MDIKTYKELIAWTRDLHAHLARCLSHCSTRNEEERARALLDYLATRESEIERIVEEFERQADTSALETRVYDYLSHHPIKTHRTCDEPYAKLDFNGICREIFDFHKQITDLYQTLVEKAEIPKVKELMESLLAMELNESKRLARQIGRMDDL
ncbi:MAG TPA: ATPase [Marinobacter sp.]|uniref:ATPase n=2 Tax=root TaxID=1 RepID=A0A831R7M2_9GAMM|nr:ATPase [Marinobacter antarcticus]HDZ39020.1 ATPase [Marinobacter sp.]HEA53719.1 ATPase [Marinobacter antarcticus]